MPTYASLYARLSVRSDEANLSLEGMVSDMRALCEKEGLTVLEPPHVDDGLSAGYRDRPEFMAWVADATSGRAQVLVNPNTDRLTREGLNVAARLLDVHEGKDPNTGRPTHKPVRLLDTKGLDSRDGDSFRIRFVLQAEIGRGERERIKDRTRTSRKRLAQAGRWPGGTPPFGYKAVPVLDDGGKVTKWVLAVEQQEAHYLREAVDRVLRGDALYRVCRWLNFQGVKPRRAEGWSRMTLGRCLTGTALLGQVSHNGRVIRDDHGNALTPFTPIVSEAEHAALRSLLLPKEKSPRPRGGRAPARLLSGLLRCHECKSVLYVSARNNRPNYRCRAKYDGGTCSAQVATLCEGVERYVTSLYLDVAGAAPMFEEKVIMEGVDEMAAVEAAILDAMSDLATKATPEMFSHLQRLQARREELTERPPEQRTEVVPTGKTVAEYWDSSPVEDRRDMLSDAFEYLILLPGVRGRHGFDGERLSVGWSEDEDYS